MPKLKVEDIVDIVRTVSQEQGFLDRNEEWRQNRELVYRRREVVFPGIEMETQYQTPHLLEFADKYTARFIGAPFSISVSSQGEGKKAFEKAQAVENLDYRLVNRWWQQKAFVGPVHDAAGVTGEGYVHQTLNRAVLPIIPVRADQEDDEAYLRRARGVLDEFASGERADLFIVEPVREPETVYYTPDRSVMFMKALVPLPQLQRQYGKEGTGGLYGEKGKSKAIQKQNGLYTITSLEGSVDEDGFNTATWSETAVLYIVEDDEYIYHFLEDDADSQQGNNVRYRSMHNLGCYKNVFGSPGFLDIRARETNHASPKYSAHPLTHGAIAIAPNLNIMSTIVYSAGILGEMQRITLRPLPGPEAALERQNNKSLEIELIGNRVVKFPDGYEAVQPNIGVNADTLNAHQMLKGELIELGFSPALEGGDVDANSGYQEAVGRDSASSLIDTFLQNLSGTISRALDRKDVAIKTLGYPVTFRNYAPTDEVGRVSRQVMSEITVEPDDIIEVDRSVKFDSLTQYARQAKIEMGLTLLEKDRITEDVFYRDYMGVDDPLRLKRMRFIEKAVALSEQYALKTAAALFGTVTGAVTNEAMATSGLEPMMQAGMGGGQQALQLSSPAGAITTSNGAGGSVPLQPAPNDMAEMGSTTEAAAYG